jgi:lipase ATG15
VTSPARRLHPTRGNSYAEPFTPDFADPLQALRYIFHHGTHANPNLHRRLNVTGATVLRDDDGQVLLTDESGPRLRASVETLNIERLADRSEANVDRILDAGRARGSPLALDASAWTVAKVPGPNVTDKETVLSFARMAANAYVTDNGGTEWEDVGRGFNYTEHFGWLNDGLRGHVFADAENKTVVIAMKGTCTFGAMKGHC